MQIVVGVEAGGAKLNIFKQEAKSSLILPNLSSKWLAQKAKKLGTASNNLFVENQVAVTTIDQVKKIN